MKTTWKSRRAQIALSAIALLAAFTGGVIVRGSHTAPTPVTQHVSPESTTWTCSMHPQIKLPKAGKCPICFMDLIPLHANGDDNIGERTLSVSENAARLMEVETVLVERRQVSASVRLVGKIDFDETRVSIITAWVPGRIDRLFVDSTGASIEKGAPLFSLFSPELLSAQEELLQATKSARQITDSDTAMARKSNEANLNAVREKLRLWGVTPEQIAEIEARDSADNHMIIHSPASGVVIHKNAQEGLYVQTGTRIYTIADLSHVWVNLEAYESDLKWLQVGQEVTFTTEAYPGETFTGTITFIDPILDQKSRTIGVRVSVANEDLRLKPGMFVRSTVEANATTEGKVPLVIPASAPLLTGKRAVVYIEIPNSDRPTYEGREVVLGPRAGNDYVVIRGLNAGDRVVTRGAFKIDAELQIRAKPSMMSPGVEYQKPEIRGQNSEDGNQVTDVESQKVQKKAQTNCPVMGGAINKDVFVDYKGMRIYFCCAGCDGPFLEKAEEYLDKMRADGIEPERIEAGHEH